MRTEVVRRFQANANGRDFVLSDIHGAYDLVIHAMKAARFDPRVDRLFVNGDLVDRGEQSLRAKRFLDQPYVFACAGNHEDWWVSLYEEGPPEEALVRSLGQRMNMGVGWWLDAQPEQRDALIAKFKSLPMAMEVETERGVVGIVHADVPKGMSWQQFTQALEAGDEHAIKCALWGRSRINSGDESGVQGIGRVFVGHTPQWSGPRRLGNVYAVDTGAIFGLKADNVDEGRLTVALLVAATGELGGVKERLECSGLVDLRDAGHGDARPFGSYATAPVAGA